VEGVWRSPSIPRVAVDAGMEPPGAVCSGGPQTPSVMEGPRPAGAQQQQAVDVVGAGAGRMAGHLSGQMEGARPVVQWGQRGCTFGAPDSRRGAWRLHPTPPRRLKPPSPRLAFSLFVLLVGRAG